MSVTQITEFTCDRCGRQNIARTLVPPNWCAVQITHTSVSEKVRHLCAECTPSLRVWLVNGEQYVSK